MIEEWRIVAAYPDYAVSSEGRVKRIAPDRHGRIMSEYIKPVKRPDGYFAVAFHRDAKQKSRLLHRVVCEAFHGAPISSDLQAAHRDGVKSNNSSANLKWATPLENSADKKAHGTVVRGDKHPARIRPEYLPRGSAHKNAKLTEDLVSKILKDARPQSLIAEEMGVSQSLISAVKTRKIWAHVTGE